MVSCLRVHIPPILVYCPPSNGGSLLLSGTKVVCSGGFVESFWVGNYFKVLIWYLINVIDDGRIALNSYVRFITSSSSLACWFLYLAFRLHFQLAWWWTVHQTCYRSCWFLLEYWILKYDEKYHINRAMVMIWCYMAQMSVDEQITWWNQCVQYVINVDNIW